LDGNEAGRKLVLKLQNIPLWIWMDFNVCFFPDGVGRNGIQQECQESFLWVKEHCSHQPPFEAMLFGC
jgi:hypothetical protein